jgi:prepilin-type processing-associated H-X9-DG protein
MKRTLKIVGISLFVLFVLAFIGLPFTEPIFILLFGWIIFPIRTFPEMTFEPAAVAVAAAALTLMIVLTHGLARWLYRSFRPEQAAGLPWRPRWTVGIVAGTLLLFVAGICIIVAVHESYWLLTSKHPWMMSGAREAIRRMVSSNNLKQIGLAAHNYAQERQELPPGGTMNEYGEMQHSWETLLLPYIEGNTLRPDLSVPWYHPRNAECFKTEVQGFLDPTFGSEHRTDARGYALSHYAVNCRVMGPNFGISIKDVTDGLGNTIMAGEVADRFKPWGDPVNWRDPALGVNNSPDGFGSPHAGGLYFLFMDGSVRWTSKAIDPQVLRALSTPNGGEKVPEDWDQ